MLKVLDLRCYEWHSHATRPGSFYVPVGETVKTAPTASTAWSLLIVYSLPVGPAWAEEPEAGLAELAGTEHGKPATSDGSPVGAHLIEGETSYAPSWNFRGRGAFDYSAAFVTHAFGVEVAWGIADDVLTAGLQDAAWGHHTGQFAGATAAFK